MTTFTWLLLIFMKDFKIEELISMLQNSGIKFIAGKWFNKFNVEIKDISSYIARSCHLFKSNDIKDVEEAFINWYGKKIGKWPEMIIVSMTKDRGPIEDKSQLPFELDEKQLIIINRILFHPEDEIMFITTGVGGSGKSTFLNIVKQLFDNDVSATTLDQLSNDFMLSQAIKHRLIASDELSKGELNNTKLKTLISKQQLSANPKGKDSYEIDGLTPLDELGETLDIDFSDLEFETLNGLMISKLEHIPAEHEDFEMDFSGYKFKILAVENKIIKRVLVSKNLTKEGEQ